MIYQCVNVDFLKTGENMHKLSSKIRPKMVFQCMFQLYLFTYKHYHGKYYDIKN